MRLAFYKTEHGRLYQKAIAWWTRPGPYCHVEVVFDGWDHVYYSNMDIQQHDAGGSLCFSSSEQDGGTRFKIIDINPEQWDTVDVPYSYERSLAWALRHQHLKYDWRGLRGFVFPWEKPDPADLFCSEAATELGQAQGVAHPGYAFFRRGGRNMQDIFRLDLLKAAIPGKTSPNALAHIVGLL